MCESSENGPLLLKTRWFQSADLPELLSIAKEGDLLEFDRRSYSHWAVYIGIREGIAYIVHNALDTKNSGPLALLGGSLRRNLNQQNVTSGISKNEQEKESNGIFAIFARGKQRTIDDCEDNTVTIQSTSVRMEKLTDVMGNDRIRVNNRKDSLWRPFPPCEVVMRAMNKLAEHLNNYNAIHYNCEHFANECRYGHPVSMQMVAAVGVAALSTILFGPVFVAAMAVNAVLNYIRQS